MLYNAKNKKIKIDDTYVNYIEFGYGKKYLVVIPGLGDSFKTTKGLALPFAFMYKIFAKDYKVLVFSRRNKLPSNFTIKDMASDIYKHLNDLNINKVDVVGVSQGGMIAQDLAIYYPNLINKLVLVVTTPCSNNILESNINLWLSLAKDKKIKEILIDTMEKSYTENYLRKLRKSYKYINLLYKKNSLERFNTESLACLNHNVLKELKNIICPTLIIGAKEDKILDFVGSKELHDNIKNSKLYLYDYYSHSVYEEAKDFNARVLKFLRKEE